MTWVLSVLLQPNPDRLDLKLRRRFVDLACQEGVHYECQSKPESGIGWQRYPREDPSK